MADFQAIFMDAGQGDCTLLVYPDGTLTLIDCGSTKSGDEAFAQIWVVLQNFLDTANPVIQNLVLTHPDEDHYNRLRSLFAAAPKLVINQVYYGGDISLYQNRRKGENNFTYNFLTNHKNAGSPKNSVSATPDPNLTRAGINVYVLAANVTGNKGGTTGALKNTNSIVLMVETAPGKLFLMGDAFVETEALIIATLAKAGQSALLAKGTGQDSLLKMGHHGSDTSTGVPWVKALTPDILVVSSGTKTFSRKGMPTGTHVDQTVAATTLNPDTGISQTYVVFDPAQARGANFITRPATTQAIWTTCYGATWVDNRWQEAGQTWYYGITDQGQKQPGLQWYGYTGYEEDENEDEDV